MSDNKIFSFNFDGKSDNIKGALMSLTTKFDSIIEWARQVDANNAGMESNMLRLIVSFDTLVGLCIDGGVFSEDEFNTLLEQRVEAMKVAVTPEPTSKIIIPKKKVIPPR